MSQSTRSSLAALKARVHQMYATQSAKELKRLFPELDLRRRQSWLILLGEPSGFGETQLTLREAERYGANNVYPLRLSKETQFTRYCREIDRLFRDI